MSKKAISVTLNPKNLLWLRGQARARGARSVSETLDQVISSARAHALSVGESRSVVGTVRIVDKCLDLGVADKDLREMFESSLERVTPPPSRRSSRSKGRGRG